MHLQNAPLILEDYLRHVRAENQCRRQNRGNQKRIDGGCEEHKAARAFAAEGPVLVGGLCAGEIVFGMPNLLGWSYRLSTGAATTVIINALVGAGPTL